VDERRRKAELAERGAMLVVAECVVAEKLGQDRVELVLGHGPIDVACEHSQRVALVVRERDRLHVARKVEQNLLALLLGESVEVLCNGN
jgi:hypothetical protein